MLSDFCLLPKRVIRRAALVSLIMVGFFCAPAVALECRRGAVESLLEQESTHPAGLRNLLLNITSEEFRHLLAKHGRTIRISGKTIEGKVVQRYVGSGFKGVMNHGIFFFRTKTDQERVIKVMVNSPDDPSGWSRFQQEILGSSLGEDVGGPKLYSFGIAEKEDSRFFYIEMESIFPTSRTQTYKGARPEFLLQRAPDGLSNAEKAADRFFDAYIHRIVPHDPDFISDGNNMRWIDTGLWRVSDADILDTEFTSLKPLKQFWGGYLDLTRDPNGSTWKLKRLMFNRFVYRLKHDLAIPNEQRHRLIHAFVKYMGVSQLDLAELILRRAPIPGETYQEVVDKLIQSI